MVIKKVNNYEYIEWEIGDSFIIGDETFPFEIQKIKDIQDDYYLTELGKAAFFGTEVCNRMSPVRWIDLLRLRLFHKELYNYYNTVI